MMVRSISIALLANVIAFGAANATTLNFDASPNAPCDVSSGASTEGFTLSAYDGSVGGGIVSPTGGGCGSAIPTAYSGTNFLLNYNALIGELTRDTGTFDLNSLYVHADARVGDTTVRFQGLDAPGGNVLYTMDVLISATWQLIVFSGWDNVKTFTWDSISPNSSNIAIDDFTFDGAEVPLPAALPLFLAGLAGLGFSSRSKKPREA